jgi:hypothetical protein
LTEVHDVHSGGLHPIHLLHMRAEISGPTPDVENTVAVTEIVRERFGLDAQPVRGSQHVLRFREALPFRAISRPDLLGNR